MTEVMDDSCPTRSLQTTLISCLCTLAVSVVSWWGDPVYMEAANAQLNIDSSFEAVVNTVVFPFSPFYNGVMHVMQVLFVRSILVQQRQEGDPSSGQRRRMIADAYSNWKNLRATMREIGVMSACPIVMPIPRNQESMLMEVRRECTVMKWENVKALRPLVMTPGGENPKTGTTSDDDEDWRRCSYIHVQTNDGGLRIRLALLNLGLVPRYSQLQHLRTRSRFQALLTFLQTLGFTMGLVERWGEGLGVSPLELLVCYFAIAALLHVGIDLFACVSFRTTLLLSLSPVQFNCFLMEFHHFHDAQLSTRNNSLRQSKFLVGIITAAYLLIFSTAAMSYYRILYWHLASAVTRLVIPLFILQQGCSLFAFSALRLIRKKLWLGELVQITADIFQRVLEGPCAFLRMATPALLLCFVAIAVSVAILVVAVVGTVNDWHLFNEAARNAVAWTVPKWILPHISSGN